MTDEDLAIAKATLDVDSSPTNMNKTAWRRVFAYVGIAVIGLALAFYSTAVATGGITAGLRGHGSDGVDLLSTGGAALLVGVAVFAVFGYLGLRLTWLTFKQRR